MSKPMQPESPTAAVRWHPRASGSGRRRPLTVLTALILGSASAQAATAQPTCEVVRQTAYSSLGDALARFARPLPITRFETPMMQAAAQAITGQMGMASPASATMAGLDEAFLTQWRNNRSVRSPAEEYVLASLDYAVATRKEVAGEHKLITDKFQEMKIQALATLGDLNAKQIKFLETTTNKRTDQIITDLKNLDAAINKPRSTLDDLLAVVDFVLAQFDFGAVSAFQNVVVGVIDSSIAKPSLVTSQVGAAGPGVELIPANTLIGGLDTAQAQVDGLYASTMTDFGRLEAVAALGSFGDQPAATVPTDHGRALKRWLWSAILPRYYTLDAYPRVDDAPFAGHCTFAKSILDSGTEILTGGFGGDATGPGRDGPKLPMCIATRPPRGLDPMLMLLAHGTDIQPGRNQFGIAAAVQRTSVTRCAGAGCQSATHEYVEYGISRPIGLVDRIERQPIDPAALAEISSVFSPDEIIWLLWDQPLRAESELVAKETGEAFAWRLRTASPAGFDLAALAPTVYTQWNGARSGTWGKPGPAAPAGLPVVLPESPFAEFLRRSPIEARRQQIEAWEAARDKAVASVADARALYDGARSRLNGRVALPDQPDEAAVKAIEATFLDSRRDFHPMVGLVYGHFIAERDFALSANLAACKLADAAQIVGTASNFRRRPFEPGRLGLGDLNGKLIDPGYTEQQWLEAMGPLYNAPWETSPAGVFVAQYLVARVHYTLVSQTDVPNRAFLFLPATTRAIGAQRYAPDADKTFADVVFPRWFEVPRAYASGKEYLDRQVADYRPRSQELKLLVARVAPVYQAWSVATDQSREYLAAYRALHGKRPGMVR